MYRRMGSSLRQVSLSWVGRERRRTISEGRDYALLGWGLQHPTLHKMGLFSRSYRRECMYLYVPCALSWYAYSSTAYCSC